MDCGFPGSEVNGISSHSLKATYLAYLAKRGVDKDGRRLLGYHSDSNDTSVLTFSRDALAGPLRELDSTLVDIIAGDFMPSCSRSGRFPEVPEPVFERYSKEEPTPVDEEPSELTDRAHSSIDDDLADAFDVSEFFDPNLEPEGEALTPSWTVIEPEVLGASPKSMAVPPSNLNRDLDDSVVKSLGSELDTSSDDSLSSSEDPDADAEILSKTFGIRSMPKKADRRSIYKHKAGRFHLGQKGDESKLACGRRVPHNYELLSVPPEFMSPVCEICFGNIITSVV